MCTDVGYIITYYYEALCLATEIWQMYKYWDLWILPGVVLNFMWENNVSIFFKIKMQN
jgi:hypothetical protein